MKGPAIIISALVALTLGLPASAYAHEDSADDGLIEGGGSSKTDCVAKFQTGLELNYPAAPKKAKELACVDGDLACDADGQIDGSCTFNLGICLADDEDLADCTPAGVMPGGVTVKNSKSRPDGDLTALQDAVDTLLGATGVPCESPGAGGGNCFQCTSPLVPVAVSLAEKKGRKKIKVRVETEPVAPKNKPIRDNDKLKLRCLECEAEGAFAHIAEIVFKQGCAASICHSGALPQAGLNLDPDVVGLDGVYNEIINEDPTISGAVALGLRRILPGDPNLEGLSSSILIEKLRLTENELNAAYCQPNNLPDGCMGTSMPQGSPGYSPGKLDLLKAWVAAGAPRDGWPAGTGCGEPEDIYVPATPLPPPPAGEGFQVHMPAPPGFFLDPGKEFEGCQWIEMPAEVTETVYVTRIEYRMNPGTHHLLLYQDIPDSGPPATPTAFDPDDALCNDQFGIKSSFGGTQDPEFVQELPDGVSFALAPGQVFGVNTHYTNSYNVPIYPEVWINFWGTTTPTPKQQEGIFPGDLTFSIPPHEEGVGNVSTHTQFGGPGCFYSLSSHAHRRNLGFKIWTADPAAGGKTPLQAWDTATNLLYYNTDWDHPIVLEPQPRLKLNNGDKLWFQCRWDNGGINPANITRRCITSSDPNCSTFNPHVCFTNADCGAGTFGECRDCNLDFGFLSEDEMCFLPGFYYDAEPNGDCLY